MTQCHVAVAEGGVSTSAVSLATHYDAYAPRPPYDIRETLLRWAVSSRDV